jgi:hypothetical protein
MKVLLTRMLFYGLLICFSLCMEGCYVPHQRPPGTPDPGVLDREANQDAKVYIGKPDSYGQDETERYTNRNGGILDNKFLGVKGIWKF